MAGMKTSVVIDCPVEEVFQFFLNPKEPAPQMDPLGGGLVLMSPDGPPGPGTTTFVFRQHAFGKTRETRTHLTAVEVNQRIKFDAQIGPMRPACSLSFEPIAGSTRVTFRGDSNPPGGLRFLTPLMNRMGQKNWTQRFAQAKALLEAPMSNDEFCFASHALTCRCDTRSHLARELADRRADVMSAA